MIGRIRRPSPAMVVACLALLVALGGTSVAAVSQLARNSVGTPQLRNNAVTTPKIRNNAVTSAKIRNGTVKLNDLAQNARVPGPAGPQGPAGPAGPAGTGAALAFQTVTGAGSSTTSSATFTDLPSATATIEVPAGAVATLLITFTAESLCTGPGGWCPVRVVVDGNEAAPIVGSDFAFDSPGTSWKSHALQRSVAGVAAGSHSVTVQYAVASGATALRLDDWGLTVLAMRQS